MRWLKNALAAALVAAFAVVVPAAPAQAAAWHRFRFSTISAGDCTMFPGATWTLYSDGTASFDGTVGSSSSDDAWLMWANLLDENRTMIGRITNSGGDPKFVRNLNGTQRWLTNGYFPADWYPHIQHMSMNKHC